MERQIPKRYLIVEATQDDGVQVHEMKKWCRLHQSKPARNVGSH